MTNSRGYTYFSDKSCFLFSKLEIIIIFVMHQNIKTLLLINGDSIPHYRIAAYNYICRYLAEYQFDLKVVAEGIQKGNPHDLLFQFYQTPIGYGKLLSLFKKTRPDVVIFWVRHIPSLYPLFLITKLKKIKLIHWGHRRYLARPNHIIKNIAYAVEHCLDDAIIVYADHLKKYVWKRFHKKTFSANNTLNLQVYKQDRTPKDQVKQKYGIQTEKNIIYIGRIQKRKRIDDLLHAFFNAQNEKYRIDFSWS